MDKIQIYLCFDLVITILGLGYLMGSSDEKRAAYVLLHVGLNLPFYGRIFGWW